MGAALAGSALTGSGRLNEVLSGGELLHPVKESFIRCHDIFGRAPVDDRTEERRSRADYVCLRSHAGRRLWVH